MRNLLKRMLVLLCVCAVALSLSTTAFAAGTVTYDGAAQKFIFAPGSEYAPNDLFPDFKNVMPGDTVTQRVTIRNEADNKVKIKLYMKSTGAQPGSEAFLSRLQLTVSQEGDSDLFAAPANETAQLTDWVYLGTFYSGAEIDLAVTLEVPLDLGDEFQSAVGYLDWQFMVEEFPIESSDPKPPKTGDDFNIALWVTLLVLSGGGIIAATAVGRKKKSK